MVFCVRTDRRRRDITKIILCIGPWGTANLTMTSSLKLAVMPFIFVLKWMWFDEAMKIIWLNAS